MGQRVREGRVWRRRSPRARSGSSRSTGTGIAICRVDGKLYAIEDICTHDDGPLGEGFLDGCEIECPRHGARFDVRTGPATRMPAAAPVRTFPLKVEDGEVLVEVETE